MFCAIKISKSDPTPLYIQLANELIRLIDDGTLPPKTKLPTIRLLSSKLKINRDTVVNAYKLLESKSYVIAHIGSGTYVAPQSKFNIESKKELSPMPCSKTYFPRELFNIDICKKLMTDILDDEGWSAFVDPLNRERQLIRQAICDYLQTVGVTASNPYARLIQDTPNFLLELMKLSATSTICVEAYRDLSYTSTLSYLGFKVLEIPLTADGLDLEVLESQLKSQSVSYILITPYIQNPTGICYSEENKLGIIELCEKYDTMLIEDGTFTDFVYESYDIKSCYNLCKSDRVIYIYNFCKLYLPNLDYSFVVLPQIIQKRLIDTMQVALPERFVRYYLESEFFDEIRGDIVESCEIKYKKISQLLSSSSLLVQTYPNRNGLFFWLKSKQGSRMYQTLLKHNIVVSPSDLFATSNNADYFRLSIASLNDSEMDILVNVLAQLDSEF
ncbi:MAG: hypothetical protein BEN18_10460 [Epulopiscium sp. Nuni2H_MBin001]|nr:MAG: hypothetical protein BEN18_10460 [Epulopiscium sp. Nuni2H_MBin001]